MHAIVFTGTSKNGVIAVPKEYKEQLQGTFQVIILQEKMTEPSIKKSSKRKRFTALSIETKGFSFTKDEANKLENN